MARRVAFARTDHKIDDPSFGPIEEVLIENRPVVDFAAIIEWCQSDDVAGSYEPTYARGGDICLAFTDPNSAFACKMRWK